MNPNAEPAKTCEGGDAILAATTIKQAEDAVEDMLQRLERERRRMGSLNDELAVLQTDNDRLHREVAAKRALGTKLDDLSRSNEALRGELDALRAERDILAETAAQVAGLALQNDTLRAETTRLSDALTTELAARASLSSELTELRTEYGNVADRLVDATTALQAAEATITALPSLDDMAQRNAEIAAVRNEVQRLTDERDAMQSELANATVALERVTSARSSRASRSTGNTAQPSGLALLDSETDMTPGRASVETGHHFRIVKPKPSPSAEPSFVIQLGAFRSRSGALSEIGRLQVISGKQGPRRPEYIPGRGLNGGSVFRIMTDAMRETEAERLCGLLWSDMVSCVLKAVPAAAN